MQKKQTTRNTAEQIYSFVLLYFGLVASYDTWPGSEVGLFYNAPDPTRQNTIQKRSSIEYYKASNNFLSEKNVT